jgi:hypothetical protein
VNFEIYRPAATRCAASSERDDVPQAPVEAPC